MKDLEQSYHHTFVSKYYLHQFSHFGPFYRFDDEDSQGMNNTNNQRQDAPRNQSFPGRKRRNSDNDEDGKQRKCGLCKQAGHTRRNCPTLTL